MNFASLSICLIFAISLTFSVLMAGNSTFSAFNQVLSQSRELALYDVPIDAKICTPHTPESRILACRYKYFEVLRYAW